MQIRNLLTIGIITASFLPCGTAQSDDAESANAAVHAKLLARIRSDLIGRRMSTAEPLVEEYPKQGYSVVSTREGI